MLRVENKPSAVTQCAIEYSQAYKDCFAWYTEEKWVKKFARARFSTISAINYEEHGVDISSRESIFVRVFTEKIMEVIADKKKAQRKKEKEEAAKKSKGGK